MVLRLSAIRSAVLGLLGGDRNEGLFCALYSDRGSHFFVTVKAGEKVDKHRLTQVGRAMKELGVQMIAASHHRRGPVGEEFRNLARASAAGASAAKITTVEGHYTFRLDREDPVQIGSVRTAKCRPFLFGRYRELFIELGDVAGPQKLVSGQGQYRRNRGLAVATGQDPLPAYLGRQ